MNTPSENAYYKLMSSDQIRITTTETVTGEYVFQLTDELIESFNKWKVEHIELTDLEPTDEEILKFYQTNSTNGFSSRTNKTISITTNELYYIND